MHIASNRPPTQPEIDALLIATSDEALEDLDRVIDECVSDADAQDNPLTEES